MCAPPQKKLSPANLDLISENESVEIGDLPSHSPSSTVKNTSTTQCHEFARSTFLYLFGQDEDSGLSLAELWLGWLLNHLPEFEDVSDF